MNKKQLIITSLIIICLFLNGCALLQLPGKLIDGTFGMVNALLRGAVELLKRAPSPPPGVPIPGAF